VQIGSESIADPVTCEGSVVWTYRYYACDGITFADWTFTYTIDNNSSPTIGNLPGSLDMTVSCAVNVPAVNNGLISGTDACGNVVTITHVGDEITTGSCPNGYSIARTYRATDCAGNTSDFVQTITVNDKTDPAWDQTIPADVTVECDEVPDPLQTVTASDNFEGTVIIDYNQVRADGSCPACYTLTRTWTATDNCGNSIQHVQVLTRSRIWERVIILSE
jgi:hypothetical protein